MIDKSHSVVMTHQGKQPPYQSYTSDIVRTVSQILARVKNQTDNRKRTGMRIVKLLCTKDDLLEQWHAQNGRCNLTGLKLLHLPSNYPNSKKVRDSIKQRYLLPSLDRKDPEGHYEAGNIQWVVMPMNYMKTKLGQQEMVEFLHLLGLKSPNK